MPAARAPTAATAAIPPASRHRRQQAEGFGQAGVRGLIEAAGHLLRVVDAGGNLPRGGSLLGEAQAIERLRRRQRGRPSRSRGCVTRRRSSPRTGRPARRACCRGHSTRCRPTPALASAASARDCPAAPQIQPPSTASASATSMTRMAFSVTFIAALSPAIIDHLDVAHVGARRPRHDKVAEGVKERVRVIVSQERVGIIRGRLPAPDRPSCGSTIAPAASVGSVDAVGSDTGDDSRGSQRGERCGQCEGKFLVAAALPRPDNGDGGLAAGEQARLPSTRGGARLDPLEHRSGGRTCLTRERRRFDVAPRTRVRRPHASPPRSRRAARQRSSFVYWPVPPTRPSASRAGGRRVPASGRR